MSTLTIDTNPAYCRYETPFRITSVAESVRKKLERFELLTHSRAIQILRKVKWEADVGSFLCKPIVHLPILALSFIGCYRLIELKPNYVSLVLGCVILPISAPLFGTCLFDIPRFQNASSAYAEKSKEAAEYLAVLRRSSVEMRVII